MLSLYVFGIPRFSQTEKTIHIYIGYATLLVILISQSLIGAGAIYDITTGLMYLFIVIHLILGIRSAMKRNSAGSDQMVELHRG